MGIAKWKQTLLSKIIEKMRNEGEVKGTSQNGRVSEKGKAIELLCVGLQGHG